MCVSSHDMFELRAMFGHEFYTSRHYVSTTTKIYLGGLVEKCYMNSVLSVFMLLDFYISAY